MTSLKRVIVVDFLSGNVLVEVLELLDSVHRNSGHLRHGVHVQRALAERLQQVLDGRNGRDSAENLEIEKI